MKINHNYVKKIIPVRKDNLNKYDFGRVMVISGSYPMIGACFLSTKAVLKAGAGMVVGVVSEKVKPVVSNMVPEAIFYSSGVKTDYIDLNVLNKALTLHKQKKFDMLLIGPGIGNNTETNRTVIDIIKKLLIPSVIDADGINAISRTSDLSFIKKIPSIITPHTGEAMGLSAYTGKKAALEIAQKTGGVVVLKDYKTIITDGTEIFELDRPNSALSKAGTGDVLCGIISGIWAQMGKKDGFNNKTALKAAVCGVYIHSLSASIAAVKKTKYSVMAGDIIDEIDNAFKRIQD